MKTVSMFTGALFAVSSSTAAAFAPRTGLAFQRTTSRAFTRSAAALMANPKGTWDIHYWFFSFFSRMVLDEQTLSHPHLSHS